VGVFDLFKKKAEPESPAKAQEATGQGSAPKSPPEQPAKQSLVDMLRGALKKTSDVLNTDVRDLFKRQGRLVDDEFLGELYAILVKTDMGTGPAARIRDRIGTDFRARVVHMEDVLKAVKDELRGLVAQPEYPVQLAASGPTVILVVGVNGSGKTTSIAKLTNYFRQQGKKVVLGAGDTFRAAAVDQLTIWADRLGAEIVKVQNQGDPAAVAHKAVARAIETQAEICIIDTAGRLQTQTNLMQQLEKIYRVIARQIPDAPHEVLLVLDATAGQNALSQAQGFSEAAKCTGIVLAKLDGTAKGGVVIPIRERFAIPVKFVGLGEKASDLAVFNADQFVDALFADAA
jgi:fused signal recognition particle receptor